MERPAEPDSAPTRQDSQPTAASQPILTPALAVLAASALLTLAMAFRHVVRYFFLSDDFGLVGLASTAPLRQMFGTPMFSFYRPVAFLLARGEFAAFGWNAPAGYAFVSVFLHATNSGLLIALARRLGLARFSSYLAGGLFLSSPWAAESYLWLACQFDLIATSGALTCLLAATAINDANSRLRVMWCGALGAAAAVIALGAKEWAVTVPVLILLVMLARSREARWRARILPFTALVATGVVGYLLLRSRVMPVLGGAYGEFFHLARNANLTANGWRFCRALAVPPMPRGSELKAVVLAGSTKYAFLACVLPAALVQAVKMQARSFILFAVALVVTLLPVLWVSLPAIGSAGGRFLYFPGVWFSLALGLGLGRLDSRRADVGPRLPAWARVAPFLVVCAYYTVSLKYQTDIWSGATMLSRVSIEQVHSLATNPAIQPLYIENMPYGFEEGPYVLKDYAFTFYRGAGLRVRARGLELACKEGRITVLRSTGGDGASANEPKPGEQVIRLELPVFEGPRRVSH